jgi:hypothetical protein
MNRLIILVVLLGIIYGLHLYQQKLDRKAKNAKQTQNNVVSSNPRVNNNLIEDTYTIDEFAFDNLSLMSTGSLDDIRKDVSKLHQQQSPPQNNSFSDEDTIMFSDYV